MSLPSEPSIRTIAEVTEDLDYHAQMQLDRITRLASRLLSAPIAGVSIVDEHIQRFISLTGQIPGRSPRILSFCSFAVDNDRPLLVPAADREPRFAKLPLVRGEPPVMSYAGLPLRDLYGTPVGTLCIMDYRHRRLSPRRLEDMHDLASWVEGILHDLQGGFHGAWGEVERPQTPPADEELVERLRRDLADTMWIAEGEAARALQLEEEAARIKTEADERVSEAEQSAAEARAEGRRKLAEARERIEALQAEAEAAQASARERIETLQAEAEAAQAAARERVEALQAELATAQAAVDAAQAAASERIESLQAEVAAAQAAAGDSSEVQQAEAVARERIETLQAEAEAAKAVAREQIETLQAEAEVAKAVAREQIEALQAEAEVAKAVARERLETLQAEAEAAQIAARERIEALQADVAAAQSEAAAAHAEAQRLAEQLPAQPTAPAVDTEREELEAALEQTEIELAVARSSAQQLRAELSEETARVAAAAEQAYADLVAAQAASEQLRAELEAARAALEARQAELEATRAQAEQDGATLIAARTASDEARAERAHAAAAQSQAELAAAQAHAERTEAELAMARAKLERLEAELAAAGQRDDQSDAELAASRAQAEHTEADLAKTRRSFLEAQVQLKAARTTIAESQLAAAEAHAELEQLRDSMAQKETEHAAALEDLRARAQQAEVEHAAAVEELKAKAQQADTEHAAAVEELRAKMQQAEVEHAAAVEELRAKMQQAETEHATALDELRVRAEQLQADLTAANDNARAQVDRVERRATARVQEAYERFAELMAICIDMAAHAADPRAVCTVAVKGLLRLTPATGASLEVPDGDSLVIDTGGAMAEPHVGYRLPINGSLAGLCLRSRKIIQTPDAQRDERAHAEAASLMKMRSILVAPLIHQGQPRGVLKIFSKEPAAFGDADVYTVQLVGAILLPAMQWAEAIGSHAGLTAQVQRQNELLARQAELLGLVGEAAFVRDAEDRIVWWSPRAAALYGLPADAVLGQSSHQVLATEFPQPLTDIERTLLSAGRWEGEVRHRHADGHLLVVHTTWRLEMDAHGRPAAVLIVDTPQPARAEQTSDVG